jgi:hypothetical protein
MLATPDIFNVPPILRLSFAPLVKILAPSGRLTDPLIDRSQSPSRATTFSSVAVIRHPSSNSRRRTAGIGLGSRTADSYAPSPAVGPLLPHETSSNM